MIPYNNVHTLSYVTYREGNTQVIAGYAFAICAGMILKLPL